MRGGGGEDSPPRLLKEFRQGMEDGLNTIPKGRATGTCNEPNAGHWEGERMPRFSMKKEGRAAG